MIVRLNGQTIPCKRETSMDKQTFIQQAQMLGLVTRDNGYARCVMAVAPEHNYKQGYPVLMWSEEKSQVLQFTPDNRSMFRDCLLPQQDMNVGHAWAQANGFPYPWFSMPKTRFHRRHENGGYSCVIQRSDGSWGYARQDGTCSTVKDLETLAEARDACLAQATPFDQRKAAKVADFTVTVIPFPKISVGMGYKCSACDFMCTHENELRQWNDDKRSLVCKDERGCRARLMRLVKDLREKDANAGCTIPQLRDKIKDLHEMNSKQAAKILAQSAKLDEQRKDIDALNKVNNNQSALIQAQSAKLNTLHSTQVDIENHPRMQAMRDALQTSQKQVQRLRELMKEARAAAFTAIHQLDRNI